MAAFAKIAALDALWVKHGLPPAAIFFRSEVHHMNIPRGCVSRFTRRANKARRAGCPPRRDWPAISTRRPGTWHRDNPNRRSYGNQQRYRKRLRLADLFTRTGRPDTRGRQLRRPLLDLPSRGGQFSQQTRPPPGNRQEAGPHRSQWRRRARSSLQGLVGHPSRISSSAWSRSSIDLLVHCHSFWGRSRYHT